MADDFFNSVAKNVKGATPQNGARPQARGTQSSGRGTAPQGPRPSTMRPSAPPKRPPLDGGGDSSLGTGKITATLRHSSDVKVTVQSRLSSTHKKSLFELRSELDDPTCDDCAEAFGEYVEENDLSAVETAIVFGEVFGSPICRRRRRF